MRSSLIFPDRKKHFDLCVCSHIAFSGDSVIVPFMWLNTLCTCLSLSLDRKLLKSKDIFIIAESSVPRAVFLVYDMYMIMMNYDWSCETYYACVPSLPTKQVPPRLSFVLWFSFSLLTPSESSSTLDLFFIQLPIFCYLQCSFIQTFYKLRQLLCHIGKNSLPTPHIFFCFFLLFFAHVKYDTFMKYPSFFLQDFLTKFSLGDDQEAT